MTTQQTDALQCAADLEYSIPRHRIQDAFILSAYRALKMVRTQHARIAALESQLAQRFDAADMATASAQGFRDGVASVSAGSEPEAWMARLPSGSKVFARTRDFYPDATPVYTHPSPQEGMAGWISVKDRLPEKNTEVLICFAELSIPSTGRYTASALDHEGWRYPQENHIWPGEHPDFEDGGSPTVTHWMPLLAAPGPADGESNV